MSIIKKESSPNRLSISIFGISVIEKNIVPIGNGIKKTTKFLHLPIYSSKHISNYEIIRKFLFIRYKKINKDKIIENNIKNFIKGEIGPLLEDFQKFEFIRKKVESNSREIKIILREFKDHENIIYEKLNSNLEKNRKLIINVNKTNQETLWAQVFNNATVYCSWLKNKNFAPGRWALGYPALYLLFRILNESKPKHILELGLGQSTRLIAQYACTSEDIEHIIVEHDSEWINFFKKDFILPENSKILQCNRIMQPYKEAKEVRTFENLDKKLNGKKFDLILIDAPFGGDMKYYSRVDVLKMLPDCLDNNFVIILDDTQRQGEINTFKEIKALLKNQNIVFYEGAYRGEKETSIICSENNKFFASL